MTRKDFDTYRGGRVNADEDPPPTRKRYPCFADQCPMPGTIWPGITQGGTGDKPGTCAWHYGVVPSDIPKVTNQLRAWDCVVHEIEQARRLLTGPLATDAAGQDSAFAQAWDRLKPLAGVWEAELAPTGLNYSEWAKHLERFIGARVVEVLSINQQRRTA